MLKIFTCTVFLFFAVSFYNIFVHKDKLTVTSNKRQSILNRQLASRKPSSAATQSKINFKQWSSAVNSKININLQKKKDSLKKLSPSELMQALREAKALPKPQRMQALRVTARRFVPESLLFYLAGNLVSLTDHGFDISKINNPRFFQTELDGVLSLEGGSHFFTFIFFNQMYSAWSQKKVQSGTASVALNKFLKSAANLFAGMAVAGLGASIVSDLGSMIYHCGLNKLKKVEDSQVSDLFATPADHFAACDSLYLNFVSGKMQSAWINELALGLIPAAALAHGVSALGKKSFKKAEAAKNWLKGTRVASASNGAKKAQSGKLFMVAGKVISGTKTVLSATWVGALINFSLFVGIERLLMSHVTEWGSKKINLQFLNSYKKNLQMYLQKGLFFSVSIKNLETNNIHNQPEKLLDQCVTKECVQDYYTNAPKSLNGVDFLQNLKLYSQTFRERRQLLLSKGQINYQNWLNSFEKLRLRYEASFQFYYDFIQKISSKDKMVQSQLMPLAYILSGKKENNTFVTATEFTEKINQENLTLNSEQKNNLAEALVFLNKQILKVNNSAWFFYKKQLSFQLKELKRQLFSKNFNTQLVGFKNLQTLSEYHNRKFICHSPIENNLNCSVVALYNQFGQPKSVTYLEKYIQSWAAIFDYSYEKRLLSQPFAKNLAEDFLLSMVCGKEEGELFTFIGWDKNFYPPKVVTLKNNSCKFHTVKTPEVHMLCDTKMSNEAFNINIFNVKKSKKLFQKTLTKDFQCAKLWGIHSDKISKYSVMSTYFAVNNKDYVSTYNNLAELVVKNLNTKFLVCNNKDCRLSLLNATTENRNLNVFEIWWTVNVDPYVLNQMNKAKQATQQILNQEILPVLYKSKLINTNNTNNIKLPISALLTKDVEPLSVIESLKIESLVYQHIAENIYKKYCKTNLCTQEFNQWSKDVNANFNKLLQNNSDLDAEVAQKITEILKISYHNFFYKLVPSLNSKTKYYFKNINQTFKVTLFEKKVLTQIFTALNAQIFELSSYRSLLLERE